MLVGSLKASLYPFLDVANAEGDAARAELHRAGKLA
jgi:hypothetical protein